ncbi:MAG: DUF3313 domain-containing protein [Thiobacillus sp.]|uniref:DUF3313 domain-containing protein n=1 Tax=Thiobacillus sp. TaxID=924 RepID=UPI0027337DC5|nr:DUF3313 domain-containing protein [Thiobacillus sp.]MDP3584758.1 DUF3313 domain-containing protein [Thiobacillus sp.]
MKKAVRLVSMGALLASFALTSAGTALAEDSGYLGDYAALKEVKDAAGDKVMRYVNPKLKPGTYQAVMIDPTQYYPAPKPSAQISSHALTDISNYLDKGLRDKLGAKLTIVSEPGPGVLRIRPAITAVAPKTVGLKPYQVIPIAFVVSSVKGRGKEAAIQIEVEVVDSVTGERMGASVRKGVGAKLASDNAALTLTDVLPLLNQWIDTGASFVTEQVK